MAAGTGRLGRDLVTSPSGPGPVWGSRAAWQIRLRWIVPPAIVIGLVVGRAIGWFVQPVPVLVVAGIVLLYNVVFWRVLAGRAGTGAAVRWIGGRSAVLQVTFDYAVTFVLIALTGGIGSPLVLFLLFHVVFAAILLPPLTAWLFAIVAGGGLTLVAAGQTVGFVPAPAVFGDTVTFEPPAPFVAGYLLAFTATALVLAATVAVIVERLRMETSRALRATAELAEERERLTLQVVHNLRAPVAAAIGLLELVTDEVLGPIEREQREYVERAVRRMRGMGDALGDLLVLARRAARAATAAREPVDMAELAREVVAVFAPDADSRGLRLECEAPAAAVVLGDRKALAEVLENLTSNAIRYTPSGGAVQVRVAAARGAAVEVSVKDTGIGIPAADRGRVFDEFFRAGNAKSADASGTGLGLAIVKQVVTQHGGQVWLESDEGAGTTFHVRLPAGPHVP